MSVSTVTVLLLVITVCNLVVSFQPTQFYVSNKINRCTGLRAVNPWAGPFATLKFGNGVSVKDNSNITGSNSSNNGKIKVVDTLVVGSGISGSAAAYYLDKAGVDVLLTEARDYAGGNLISKRNAEGFQWEEGPNSFQPSPTILRFAKDIGKLDELVLADPTLPRFVFWENKLFALPGGVTDLPFFGLLTWPGKIRAGLGAIGLIAARPESEESIRAFVTRHLGAEVFERVIDPFVSGVYAGDPNKLSMRSALKKVYNLEDLGINKGILSGALVRIQQIGEEKKKNQERDADLPAVPGGSLGSFKDGLQSLPLQVQQLLGEKKVKLNYKLVNVAKDDNSQYVCTFQNEKGALEKVRAKSVVLTAPSYVTAPLIGGDEGVLAEASGLNNINYPPVASVTVAYPTDSLRNGPLVGFGHLIPRAMKVRTLGTIWSSSLFPGRAPAGYTMLLNYIGGAQDVGIGSMSNEDIVAQVHQDVKKVLLKEDAPEPIVLGVKLWKQAIPQYNIGHANILSTVESACREKCPGLYLGGNYRTGVAFGDCVQYGVDIAKEVEQFLKVQQLSTV